VVMCGAGACEEVRRGRSVDIIPLGIASRCWSERWRGGESPEQPPLMSSIFDGSRQGTTGRLMPVVCGFAGSFLALAEKATVPFIRGPSRPTTSHSQTRQKRQQSLPNRNRNLSH
jgi:hypothetical protein